MTAKFYGFERSFLHDTTEEDSWVIDMVRASEYVKLESDVAALQEKVRALAVLAEERREFIVNGAELGHIEMPVFNDDPATAIYQRCLLNSEFAAAAALREIRAQSRAEGIHFAANRILAAWESGFIDDAAAAAYDISGAVLSAVEFLPNADEGEFKREYADEVRARIRAGEKS